MARLKKLSKKTFLKDLYQIFDFDSEDELEKFKTRLFPIGKSTDENQTTSIFLSSLSAVKEYKEDLFDNIGIKKIKNQNIQLHIYTEIASISKEDRPDGLIIITSGLHNPVIEWASFVESKIGNNNIDLSQIERYVRLGKELGIENLITISNQLVSTPYESPVTISKRLKFNLFHWSWIYLSVTAGRLLNSKDIKDEDHVYILSELRKYFKSHNGIKNYTGMEKNWKEVTEDFLDKSNKSLIEDIITSYKQEEKDICLQLTEDTGLYINLKTNNKSREDLIRQSLEKSKTITSTFFINDNPSKTFSLDIDFVTRKIVCSTRYVIENGKSKAQTTKLINMFYKDISNEDDILIGAIYPRRSLQNTIFKSLSELLKEKEEGSYSINNKDYGDTIKEFEIRICDDLGKDFHRPQIIVSRLESLAKLFLEKVFIVLK